MYNVLWNISVYHELGRGACSIQLTWFFINSCLLRDSRTGVIFQTSDSMLWKKDTFLNILDRLPQWSCLPNMINFYCSETGTLPSIWNLPTDGNKLSPQKNFTQYLHPNCTSCIPISLQYHPLQRDLCTVDFCQPLGLLPLSSCEQSFYSMYQV